MRAAGGKCVVGTWLGSYLLRLLVLGVALGVGREEVLRLAAPVDGGGAALGGGDGHGVARILPKNG